ncbi:hypothetical protein [Methylobacter sp. BlB1]|uniref:hypothetical protein n=1 Tax=Methylobacter sp. BlB1 TaxID=2785914 RepID=UPI0018934BE9|nr:hypothetical protein [Methylobacter sp. BlB1]MBF6647182.1 hypothetical protein [Methylobacter sp. BlB1]
MIQLLTHIMHAAMLHLLSQKTKVGIETPHKGHNRPLSTVVFLCPSKRQTVLRRLHSVMEGCIGQTLKQGLAGSFAGSLNPMQSAAQRLRPKGSGLSIFKGATAMRNAQNPANKSSQYKYSLFNLVKRTTEGRQLICQDLTFAQAAALVTEVPATVIKFSRFVW